MMSPCPKAEKLSETRGLDSYRGYEGRASPSTDPAGLRILQLAQWFYP